MRRISGWLSGLGPIRQGLIVLALAGTVLNLWITADSQAKLPALMSDAQIQAEVDAEHEKLKNWPEPPVEIPRGAGFAEQEAAEQQNDARLQAMVDYGGKAEAQIINDRGAVAARPGQLFKIWEGAAKIEFTLLAGFLFLWLLSPRLTHH